MSEATPKLANSFLVYSGDGKQFYVDFMWARKALAFAKGERVLVGRIAMGRTETTSLIENLKTVLEESAKRGV